MFRTGIFRTKPQQYVCLLHRGMASIDADAFDGVITIIAQPGRIRKQQRNPFDRHGHLNHIARGPGNVGDNGRLPPHQRI